MKIVFKWGFIFEGSIENGLKRIQERISMALYNRVNRQEMRERLMAESFARETLSLYRYVHLTGVKALRDQLFREWSKLGVFGRVYLAEEGINAQISVPKHHAEEFRVAVHARAPFAGVAIKSAIEDDGKSFYRLTIKVKEKLVADGLSDPSFDASKVGRHVTAAEFNTGIDDPEAIVVDMRNSYESEVGRFEKALTPKAVTFKEELPEALEMLKGKRDTPIYLYCTGGIRCEKASAYLLHHGFSNVSQLEGGILDYIRQVKAEGLDNKFLGKNFVFDERFAERVSEDVLAHCHQCGKPADDHRNCSNTACHRLFIQCDSCFEARLGACTDECEAIVRAPEDEQPTLKLAFSEKYGHIFRGKGRIGLPLEKAQELISEEASAA